MFVSCHEMFVSYVMQLLIVRKFSVAVLLDNPNSLSSCTLTVGLGFTTLISSLVVFLLFLFNGAASAIEMLFTSMYPKLLPYFLLRHDHSLEAEDLALKC